MTQFRSGFFAARLHPTDVIPGSPDDDTLTGTAGDDTINGGLGADLMQGGEGSDRYVVDNIGDVVEEAADGGDDGVLASIDYQLGDNVEYLRLGGSADLNGAGNALDNVIIGNSGDNKLYGGDGRDTLTGGGGKDTLHGGWGADLLVGGGYADLYGEEGNDVLRGYGLWGGNGNDRLFLLGGVSNGASGGDGDDRIEYIGGSATPGHMNGDDGNDTLIGARSADGGYGDDLISASVPGFLHGDWGNDTLLGSSGTDYLYGDDGWDFEGGNDVVMAGAGDDWVTDYGIEADTYDGGDGIDTYDGNFWMLDDGVSWVFSADTTTPNGDVLSGFEALYLDLGDGDDYVDASTATKAIMTGGHGDDTLIGGDGDDFFWGNGNRDVLIGGKGNDTFSGDSGSDTLTGGKGHDKFQFDNLAAPDTVTDFVSGTDHINLMHKRLPIGDGNHWVSNPVEIDGPGGFSSKSELVIVTRDIDGEITAEKAAAAIGSADSAYKSYYYWLSDALFVVDNGTDTALYCFNSADDNALVSASELTLLATLAGTASTTIDDYDWAHW